MTVIIDERTTYLASVVGVNEKGQGQHKAILIRQVPTKEDATDVVIDRFSMDCPGYAIIAVSVSAYSELRHVETPAVWAPVPPPAPVKKKRFHIQIRPWCFLLGVYWEPSNKTLHVCPLPWLQIAVVF